jgi:hypothetical protein
MSGRPSSSDRASGGRNRASATDQEREHTMNMAMGGLVAGLALGFAGYFGGFGAFVLVAALGAIGFAVGRYADGDLDAGALFRGRGAGGGRGGRFGRGDRFDRDERFDGRR